MSTDRYTAICKLAAYLEDRIGAPQVALARWIHVTGPGGHWPHLQLRLRTSGGVWHQMAYGAYAVEDLETGRLLEAVELRVRRYHQEATGESLPSGRVVPLIPRGWRPFFWAYQLLQEAEDLAGADPGQLRLVVRPYGQLPRTPEAWLELWPDRGLYKVALRPGDLDQPDIRSALIALRPTLQSKALR